MIDRIVGIHRADPEQPEDNACDQQINSEKAFGYLRDAWQEALVCDARGLSIEQLRGGTAKNRHQGNGKHDDPDTTLPLGQAAPEQQSFRQGLDVGQDGCSGSSEAGHRFEEGIRDVVNIAAYQVRQHAEKGKHRPHK